MKTHRDGTPMNGNYPDLDTGRRYNYKDGVIHSVEATWYKRPFSGAAFNEKKNSPGYYVMKDDGKDGMLAFRAVVQPNNDLCVACSPGEAYDLEKRRQRKV